MRAGFLSNVLLRLSAALLLFAAASAFAQDPPGRIGRINYSEGTVSFAPAGDDEFTDADLNRPLVVGDKLWTDKGVRADLQVGSAAVRMDGRTHLTVLAIDDQSTQLSVTQGTVFVRVRSLPEGENFEIDTPNLAWRASYPGDYRIDVDAQRGTTRVTIHSGTGAVYGEKAQALPMGGGQQIVFKGRALAQVNSNEQPPQDNFDRWAAERNRREDQSVAARYVPREVVGYQLLDTGGQWQQDPNYGVVWFPASVKEGWAPYRNGRWEWIAPWGWTWIDETPWAFVTTHYGRWALVGKQWGWVPGRMGLRPIYSPALVAFVGNTAPVAGAKQAIAWFPLAPGEAWQPTYKASALYTSTVNANMPPVQQGGTYVHQRRPEALTALAVEDFQRGKPSKGNAMRVAAGAFSTAQVIAPPGMPEKSRTFVARTPAPSPDFKPAVNRGPTAAQQLEAQRQADEAKQAETQRQAAHARQHAEANAQKERERIARDEQVQRQLREEQAKAEHARRAEEAKLAQEQKRAAAEDAKLAKEQQRRAAQETKLAQEQQKRAAAEEARIAQEQKRAAAEQARVAQQQRAAEQTARRSEPARARDDREKRERSELAARRAADEARQVAQERKRAADEAKVAQQRQRAAAEQAKREVAARREQARREQVAAIAREREAKREQAAAKVRAERELQARRAEAKRLAVAKKEDEARRIAHAQQVEQSRRAAEREAQILQAQRAQREEVLRRVAEEKEKERTQREAWARQQQQLAEQWKRDQQAYEEQQRRAQQRQRPDLRRTQPATEPEVWQRGVPIINPGRTS